jgi:hypothetical protein
MSQDDFEISPVCPVPVAVKISYTSPPPPFFDDYHLFDPSHFYFVPITYCVRHSLKLFFIKSPNATFLNGINCEHVPLLLLKDYKLN